jgi:hypothetical protein
MTMDDLCAIQQVVVVTYLRSLMAFATFPLVLAEEMHRDHRDHAGRSGPELDSTSRAGSIVPITSRSFKSCRDRESRTLAGTVLNYAAFARRVKRKMVKMTSTRSEP